MASRIRAAFASTAVRLSLLFLALFLLTAVVLVVYVTSFSVRVLQSQTRTAIEEQVAALELTYQRSGIPGLVRMVDRQARQPGANLYLIADTSGRIVSGNVMSIEPGTLDASGWVLRPFVYERFDENGAREYRAIAQVMRLPNGLTLLVGRDVGEPERFRAVVRQSLALALGIMTLGAFLIWFFIGRRALLRIDAVSAESTRIIGGDLTRRLPVSGSGDEFDRLALSLNALIERMSRLDTGVRDVATNVAHDLRTPLTRLRTRADHALASSRNAKDLRAALEACIAESDQLIRTFNAILMISRLEAGAKLDNREPVTISALIADVTELYEPTAEESGIQLTANATPGLIVHAHRELLAQALSNLIENALRHGVPPQGDSGTVDVRAELRGNRLALIVADNGPGIPLDKMAEVTGRFVRLEQARSTPGSGLGLSLVKAIAEAHGGALELSDNAPGLMATILVPDAALGASQSTQTTAGGSPLPQAIHQVPKPT